MMKMVLGLCLSLWLVFGLAGNARAVPAHLGGPVHLTDGAVIPAAEGSLAGMDEVFRMEPPRLLFLGAGIVAGAVIISPGLGVSELFGVVLGIIGSEFLYRTTYQPAFSYHLF